MFALETANTHIRIAREIQVFRIRVCRSDNRYSNFQFATRSAIPTVTNLVTSMLSIPTSQAEGELRYGMASPSSCERALKKLLGEMGDDAELALTLQPLGDVVTHYESQYLHGDRWRATHRLGPKLRDSMPSTASLYRSMGLQLHIGWVRSYVRVCPAAITVVVPSAFAFRRNRRDCPVTRDGAVHHRGADSSPGVSGLQSRT